MGMGGGGDQASCEARKCLRPSIDSTRATRGLTGSYQPYVVCMSTSRKLSLSKKRNQIAINLSCLGNMDLLERVLSMD